MSLTAEQLQSNWIEFNTNIETYITGDRKQRLLDFYKKYEERVILMPAAHKKEYHSAFPGGYVDHVNRVVKAALSMSAVWEGFGCDMTTFTQEELVFSAINHDIGKMGDSEHEAYIPQTDKWRQDKLGEDYMFNKKLAFAAVPDRGLFLLQEHDIKYTFNEMLAIQTHDGLYDSANEKYLKGFMPEQKPRTSLPFILHQADMMAARIEFEIEWLHKFSKNSLDAPKKNYTLSSNKKPSTKNRALNSVKSEGLKNMLDSL
jgi:hypothetical protein|tara:strand:- start:14674 stop:15450 length:777 start_codon:yes stop_codon:yes gene_type:complete